MYSFSLLFSSLSLSFYFLFSFFFIFFISFERKRYENEIQNLRKELDENTKTTIDTCRNQLKRELISEINTERENIIKQKQITIAKIKTL